VFDLCFQNSQAAITLATHYLESQYRTLNRPYSMALTAYALSLVNSAEKFKANDRLVQNAVYDNGSCVSLQYQTVLKLT